MNDPTHSGGVNSHGRHLSTSGSGESESIPDTNVENSAPKAEAPSQTGFPEQDILPCRRNPKSLDDRRPRSCRPEPPVTKATLSELDVTKIVHNPKLRHDINFDPDLHFRPNLDGEKGRKKQEKAMQFWQTLKEQLAQFAMDRENFNRRCEEEGYGHDWALPLLLKAVKEIIQTLVPLRDRELLDEAFDVDLLIQQLNQNAADLEKLASWLSQVLKSHCAPMRDDWVDEMYNQLSRGNRDNDIEELVRGMRTLLSVLEAMKLDVANHQIRCLRPVLIDDTVPFEHRFFYKKIQAGKFSTEDTKLWYAGALRDFQGDTAMTHEFGETAVFFKALCRLIMPSSPRKEPNSFLFDEERILKLRADMLDAINLTICMKLWEELKLEAEYRAGMAPSAAYLAHVLGGRMGLVDDDSRSLSSSSSAADAGEFDFNTSRSPRPHSMAFSAAGSDSPLMAPLGSGSATTSPASGSIIFTPSSGSASVAFQSPLLTTPLSPSASATAAATRSDAKSVYNALLALLQTAPPTQRQAERWTNLIPHIAVELFRDSNAPSDRVRDLERSLAANLLLEPVTPAPHSQQRHSGHDEPDASTVATTPLYQETESHFHTLLLSALGRRVREFRALSGVAMFAVATGGRINGPGRTWDAGRSGSPHPDGRAALDHPSRSMPGSVSGSSLLPGGISAGRVGGAATPSLHPLHGHQQDEAVLREESAVEDMATRLAHLGVLHWRVWSGNYLSLTAEHDAELEAAAVASRRAVETSGVPMELDGAATASYI